LLNALALLVQKTKGGISIHPKLSTSSNEKRADGYIPPEDKSSKHSFMFIIPTPIELQLLQNVQQIFQHGMDACGSTYVTPVVQFGNLRQGIREKL
jgi:hypothetical protein